MNWLKTVKFVKTWKCWGCYSIDNACGDFKEVLALAIPLTDNEMRFSINPIYRSLLVLL
jgi:hypothetical protein